jgi:hypothetical protein
LLTISAKAYVRAASLTGRYIDYLKLESTFVCVSIDIKPGSYPNSINLCSHGVVPVAILSGDGFDATTIDPTSVMFAGALLASPGQPGTVG